MFPDQSVSRPELRWENLFPALFPSGQASGRKLGLISCELGEGKGYGPRFQALRGQVNEGQRSDIGIEWFGVSSVCPAALQIFV